MGPMRVLVTGGTGSIGAWVVHELVESGHDPVVVDVDPTLTYLEDVRDQFALHECDVTDSDALASVVERHDVDRIIHLAKLLPVYSERHPLSTLRVNVLGSGTVLGVAADSGVDRVVISSSKSVFDDVTGDHGPPEFEPISESYPTFQRTTPQRIPFYSVTNKMMEYFAVRYARAEELAVMVTRFGSTWGPGKNDIQEKYADETRTVGGSLICEMIDRAMAGSNLVVSETQLSTDNATYTKDVARGLVRAVEAEDVPFERYHRDYLFDGGRVVSHRDVIEVLEERFPDFDVEVRSAETDDEPHRHDVKCRFDLSRSRSELGYEPAFGDPAVAVDDYVETNETYRG